MVNQIKSERFCGKAERNKVRIFFIHYFSVLFLNSQIFIDTKDFFNYALRKVNTVKKIPNTQSRIPSTKFETDKNYFPVVKICN